MGIELKDGGDWHDGGMLEHYMHQELEDRTACIHIEVGDNDPKDGKKRVGVYFRSRNCHRQPIEHYDDDFFDIKEKVESEKDSKLVGIYADLGFNGRRTDNRKSFLRMIEDCKAGRIDRIVTRSLGKFSPDIKEAVKTVRLLMELGVSVFIERERVDTSKPGGDIILTIIEQY